MDAYDYNNTTGDIDGHRVFAKFPEEWGLPDGNTVDANGDIWYVTIRVCVQACMFVDRSMFSRDSVNPWE